MTNLIEAWRGCNEEIVVGPDDMAFDSLMHRCAFHDKPVMVDYGPFIW